MGSTKQKDTIEATKTTFRILETLIDSTKPLGVTDLASQTGVHKSTVYKHLHTLHQLGYVDKTERKYVPTIRFLDFGLQVSERASLLESAKPHIDELAETVSEAAGLVIERDGVAVDAYIAHGQSNEACSAYNRRFLHCSAPGKALLSTWSADAARRYVTDQRLPSFTTHTLTDHPTLLDEISRVRDNGFAFEREEQYACVNGVATTISHADWNAAVCVSGNTAELSGKRFKDIIPGTLQSTARRIESEF